MEGDKNKLEALVVNGRLSLLKGRTGEVFEEERLPGEGTNGVVASPTDGHQTRPAAVKAPGLVGVGARFISGRFRLAQCRIRSTAENPYPFGLLVQNRGTPTR